MLARLKDLVGRIPALRRLREERNQLSAEVLHLRQQLEVAHEDVEAFRRAGPAYMRFPAGHFYSPIPDLPDVLARSETLFDRTVDVPGVDLRLPEQLALLDDLSPTLARWPYPARPGERRFLPDNGFYGWTDAQLWYAQLITWRPRKVVEIGSGWSTALVLDTCESEGLRTEVVAVEPYPDRLRSVMRPGDQHRVRLVKRRAQDMPAEELADLRAGDVLFVDSTHVAKIGSDVNYLIFEVFPLLPPGVFVHVHDVPYPFEYSLEWVQEGRAWNEAYVLHALLMDNPHWQIVLWPSLLWHREPERMRSALHPQSLIDGASLWLKTV
jgi:hypothetical protein